MAAYEAKISAGRFEMLLSFLLLLLPLTVGMVEGSSWITTFLEIACSESDDRRMKRVKWPLMLRDKDQACDEVEGSMSSEWY